MDLFPFQIAASTVIAERFAQYNADPLLVTLKRKVPFYQNLSSITGSGKTLILADAIAQIRSHLPIEPIILWVSKGRVVVLQTYTNLSSGKYTELVTDFTVKPLLDCKQSDIENPSSGLLLVTTAGKFNQKDKEAGDRKIYQLAFDIANESLWDMLKKRRDSAGNQRPFIIIYDEGHNLTNQQTEHLLELNPDALIAASATMRIPDALSQTISRLKQDKKWKDADFVTVVKSGDVVHSGLVKQKISLGGYITPMESAIDDMMSDMRRVGDAAMHLGLPFRPKAIYVSNTNIVTGGNNTDNTHTPFQQRQARPILIWRHLVENHKIDPATIAVYCNLKFDPKFPPPPSFTLFAGGDSDYDNFIAGNYQHVIFNLTLQEGWDDPACYFAYIDKSMGSKDQVSQVIGRVLRQPNAQHYPDPSLNTAHFYIRTDEKSVFNEVLEDVKRKLAAESPEINLTVYTANQGTTDKIIMNARKQRKLPEIVPDTARAQEQIRKIFASLQDYRQDKINTVGKGGRIQILQTIGVKGEEQQEWVEVDHSNKVTARWIFAREVQKAYAKAANICDIEDERFDVLVEYSSRAADHIRDVARRVVEAYVEYSVVTHNFINPKDVPAISVDPSSITYFNNALHEGYSGLNSFEEDFARTLDKTQRVWFRNSSKGLFEIPILAFGRSKTFNPDFIVWADKALFAIDTKGDHLIFEDAGRKLFSIKKIGSGPDLFIRLITHGKWNDSIEKVSGIGYSVWLMKNGKPRPHHTEGLGEAVQICLQPDD